MSCNFNNGNKIVVTVLAADTIYERYQKKKKTNTN